MPKGGIFGQEEEELEPFVGLPTGWLTGWSREGALRGVQRDDEADRRDETAAGARFRRRRRPICAVAVVDASRGRCGRLLQRAPVGRRRRTRSPAGFGATALRSPSGNDTTRAATAARQRFAL